MDLLIDVVLLLILSYGIYFGYKRGLFIMVAKPTRAVTCILASLAICRSLAETAVYPCIVYLELFVTVPDAIVKAFSYFIGFTATFFALKFLIGRLICFINGILDDGILMMTNRIAGVILSCVVSLAIAWIIAVAVEQIVINDRLVDSEAVESFGEGGYLYRLLINIDPIH